MSSNKKGAERLSRTDDGDWTIVDKEERAVIQQKKSPRVKTGNKIEKETEFEVINKNNARLSTSTIIETTYFPPLEKTYKKIQREPRRKDKDEEQDFEVIEYDLTSSAICDTTNIAPINKNDDSSDSEFEKIVVDRKACEYLNTNPGDAYIPLVSPKKLSVEKPYTTLDHPEDEIEFIKIPENVSESLSMSDVELIEEAQENTEKSEPKTDITSSNLQFDFQTLAALFLLTTAIGFVIGHGIGIATSLLVVNNPQLKVPPKLAELKEKVPSEEELRKKQNLEMESVVERWKSTYRGENSVEDDAKNWMSSLPSLKKAHQHLAIENFKLKKAQEAMQRQLNFMKVMSWRRRSQLKNLKEQAKVNHSYISDMIKKEVDYLEKVHQRERKKDSIDVAENKMPYTWKDFKNRWGDKGKQETRDDDDNQCLAHGECGVVSEEDNILKERSKTLEKGKQGENYHELNVVQETENVVQEKASGPLSEVMLGKEGMQWFKRSIWEDDEQFFTISYQNIDQVPHILYGFYDNTFNEIDSQPDDFTLMMVNKNDTEDTIDIMVTLLNNSTKPIDFFVITPIGELHEGQIEPLDEFISVPLTEDGERTVVHFRATVIEEGRLVEEPREYLNKSRRSVHNVEEMKEEVNNEEGEVNNEKKKINNEEMGINNGAGKVNNKARQVNNGVEMKENTAAFESGETLFTDDTDNQDIVDNNDDSEYSSEYFKTAGEYHTYNTCVEKLYRITTSTHRYPISEYESVISQEMKENEEILYRFPGNSLIEQVVVKNYQMDGSEKRGVGETEEEKAQEYYDENMSSILTSLLNNSVEEEKEIASFLSYNSATGEITSISFTISTVSAKQVIPHGILKNGKVEKDDSTTVITTYQVYNHDLLKIVRTDVTDTTYSIDNQAPCYEKDTSQNNPGEELETNPLENLPNPWHEGNIKEKDKTEVEHDDTESNVQSDLLSNVADGWNQVNLETKTSDTGPCYDNQCHDSGNEATPQEDQTGSGREQSFPEVIRDPLLNVPNPWLGERENIPDDENYERTLLNLHNPWLQQDLEEENGKEVSQMHESDELQTETNEDENIENESGKVKLCSLLLKKVYEKEWMSICDGRTILEFKEQIERVPMTNFFITEDSKRLNPVGNNLEETVHYTYCDDNTIVKTWLTKKASVISEEDEPNVDIDQTDVSSDDEYVTDNYKTTSSPLETVSLEEDGEYFDDDLDFEDDEYEDTNEDVHDYEFEEATIDNSIDQNINDKDHDENDEEDIDYDDDYDDDINDVPTLPNVPEYNKEFERMMYKEWQRMKEEYRAQQKQESSQSPVVDKELERQQQKLEQWKKDVVEELKNSLKMEWDNLKKRHEDLEKKEQEILKRYPVNKQSSDAWELEESTMNSGENHNAQINDGTRHIESLVDEEKQRQQNEAMLLLKDQLDKLYEQNFNFQNKAVQLHKIDNEGVQETHEDTLQDEIQPKCPMKCPKQSSLPEAPPREEEPTFRKEKREPNQSMMEVIKTYKTTKEQKLKTKSKMKSDNAVLLAPLPPEPRELKKWRKKGKNKISNVRQGENEGQVKQYKKKSKKKYQKKS